MTTDRQSGSVPDLDAYRYRKVGPVELFVGDAAQVLAAMPDHSVDCLVCSPPFWSLLYLISMNIDYECRPI